MEKATLVASRNVEGRYGFYQQQAIVDHHKYGRILITEQWGGGAATPARLDMPPVIMFPVEDQPAIARHAFVAEVVEPLEPVLPVVMAKSPEVVEPSEPPAPPKNLIPSLEVVPKPHTRVRSCSPTVADLPEKDEQFYPTPPDLARDMVFKIKGNPRTIVDPSAGKGDLLQRIKDGYSHRNADFYAIEIDNNLRAVLQSNKFTVLDSDFLAYAGPDKFDCIIMNPPFKRGAEHLLKAIDIMYSGQIICLLNAETLRNPCTNTRKDLVRKLGEMGAKIEYKENRFLGAERRTAVDVALVDITIERRVEDDLFAGTTGTARTDCDEQVRDEYAVSTKKTIEEMVASFREVVGLTTETIVNFYRHHNKVGRYVGLNEEPRTTWKPEKGHELTKILQAVVNSTVRKIRVDYWRRTLELPEVRERLTQKRRAEFEEKLKANDTMDFTESNIRQFLMNLIDGYSKTLQDGVDEVFDLMTKRHCYDDGLRTENIHYFNGWKTNSAYRVGQKVILPVRSSYGSPFTGYSGWKLDWNAGRTLSDIDLVMSYFNGGVEYVRLTDAINKAFAKNEQSGQSTFFKFKCHQKGTIHLTFLDENILRRFNVAACMGKGFLPGDYGKKKWRDMSNNEQKVAESFEPKGERSYTANQGQPLFDATINPARLLEDAQ